MLGGPPYRRNQHPSRKQRDWYPYYAGFTEDFVEGLLCVNWHEFHNVLDPWSGSGTTSAVCTKTGISSRGLDINPALTVIARGRFVSHSTRNELTDLTKQVVSAVPEVTPSLRSSDLLRLWFTDDSILHIRSIETAIWDICGIKKEDNSDQTTTISVDEFSALMSFLYTALFASMKNILRGFRSTNPMWIKKSKTSTELESPSRSVLLDLFQSSAAQLAALLSMPKQVLGDGEIPVSTGDATNLPFADNSFDSVVTSPPYATRLDYVNGTLPELAIIGATEQAVSDLRRRVTGSPVFGRWMISAMVRFHPSMQMISWKRYDRIRRRVRETTTILGYATISGN